MSFTHANADAGAELDSVREHLAEFNNKITRDDGNVIEYICGEGDPPFVKYRMTLEPVSVYSPEEFEAAEVAQAAAA